MTDPIRLKRTNLPTQKSRSLTPNTPQKKGEYPYPVAFCTMVSYGRSEIGFTYKTQMM